MPLRNDPPKQEIERIIFHSNAQMRAHMNVEAWKRKTCQAFNLASASLVTPEDQNTSKVCMLNPQRSATTGTSCAGTRQRDTRRGPRETQPRRWHDCIKLTKRIYASGVCADCRRGSSTCPARHCRCAARFSTRSLEGGSSWAISKGGRCAL